MTASAPQLVRGRYVLCEEIAAGGMATVHLGRLLGPVGFARIVAIKRLHAHFAKDPEFVAMLLDEARLAARIRHPNVVSTLDVVVEKGEMLVVMEYVQGESISRLIRAAHALGEEIPLGVIASIMAGSLYGLHAAHEATSDQGQPLGIVHRDVSPQNVLVGVDGVARVLDFGVAKAAGRAQITREGTLKGKLAYMSPEQVVGAALDRRSDVYSASVVLWEMLCRRRLHQADNEAATIHKILHGGIVPPSTHAPGLPAAMDQLVLRGLARDANARFATAWDMAEALGRIAHATPGDVASWVRRVCGDALEARARRVAEIESNSGVGDVPDAPTTTYEPGGVRLSSAAVAAIADRPSERSGVTDFSAATPKATRRGVTPGALIGVSVGVLAILGIGIGLGVVAARPATQVVTAASSPAPPASVVAPPVATAGPSATAPTDGTASALPSSSQHSVSAAPVRPTATAKPHPIATSKCNPPYTVDANGIRTPKPECL